LIADHPPTWVYNVTMADVEKSSCHVEVGSPNFLQNKLAGWQADRHCRITVLVSSTVAFSSPSKYPDTA